MPGSDLVTDPATATEQHGDARGATRGRIAVTDLVKRFDGPDVLQQVSLEVEPGEMLALLGPSGCGKTTLLRSIAGLERIDAGTVELDGQVVSGPGRHVAPQDRRIGMVFQDWALFPHLTVGDNVGYGLSRHERRSGRVDETLGLVGLAGLADRMPATLSGGQQQRVALARALAPQPRALLLDEPFSNLDTTLRVQVRTEVHRLLAGLGVTTVFVTHDQEEAFVLGDRVAVMNGGVIEQLDTPASIYELPATRWVAEFVGDANLVRGEADGTVADTVIGPVPLATPVTGSIDVLVRPEHLVLAPDGPSTVELVEYYGHDHVLLIALPDGTWFRVRGPGAPRFERGQSVEVRTDGSPSVAFATD